MELGEIITMPLKEVFPKEATNFTPYLAKNLDRLSEAIGVDISNEDPEIEKRLTTMKVDIAAKTSNDEIVIIENQYGSSDHDHLGKLITYAAYLDASYAVWIVENAHEEHIRAIEFLNRNIKTCLFYLVEVKPHKIDDSKPAIEFDAIIKPDNPESDANKELPPARQKCYDFWSAFLPCYYRKVKQTSDRIPTTETHMGFGCGNTKFHFDARITPCSSAAIFVCWSPDSEWNTLALKQLAKHREEIETQMGKELQWNFNPDKRGSMLEYQLSSDLGGYNSSNIDALIDSLSDALIKFRKVITPYVNEISKI